MRWRSVVTLVSQRPSSGKKLPRSLLKVVAGVLKKCSSNIRYGDDNSLQKDSWDGETIHGNLRRTGPVFFTGPTRVEPISWRLFSEI
jgi:hypothetical protein